MTSEIKRKPQKSKTVSGEPKPARQRRIEPSARREAILEAALSVFAESGYESARLDAVADRAGVAKGTLYLYIDDKDALFEEVIRGTVSPVLERMNALAAIPDIPFDKLLEALFGVFQKEVLGTKRKLLIRLIIAEGPRFPRIAEFYYRNVVSRILPLISKVAERAAARGELASDALVRFPQLLAAPLLMTIIWDGLFARIKPLDVEEFLRAYRALLTNTDGSAAS
jgi:AcrR family transcriptional regulator